MKIIGFSGKKQSGKTTAIKHLQPILDAEIINFADALKELITQFFVPNADYGELGGAGLFEYEESKQELHPCGKTYRELLQLVGTDWCRTLWPDIWLENYKYGLSCTGGEYVLTADVRFPNEVACIQQLGGHVIRLLRAPFPEDRHESETALDEIESISIAVYWSDDPDKEKRNLSPAYKNWPIFDAIIDNREMTIPEQNEAVWKLVTERNWI
jgi:hypothetical protein